LPRIGIRIPIFFLLGFYFSYRKWHFPRFGNITGCQPVFSKKTSSLKTTCNEIIAFFLEFILAQIPKKIRNISNKCGNIAGYILAISKEKPFKNSCPLR